jgi:hypothetical protein
MHPGDLRRGDSETAAIQVTTGSTKRKFKATE